MNNRKPHYALQRILRELDSTLEGMTETEAAWLLAELRARCWQRMLIMDEQTRLRAETQATSPLKFLRRGGE